MDLKQEILNHWKMYDKVRYEAYMIQEIKNIIQKIDLPSYDLIKTYSNYSKDIQFVEKKNKELKYRFLNLYILFTKISARNPNDDNIKIIRKYLDTCSYVIELIADVEMKKYSYKKGQLEKTLVNLYTQLNYFCQKYSGLIDDDIEEIPTSKATEKDIYEDIELEDETTEEEEYKEGDYQ